LTEAWISLNSETSAARLMFKSVTARRAVGLGQLCLTVEAASRTQIAEGKPIWVGGTVEVTNLGLASGHLGNLRTQIQPTTLPKMGGSRDITFLCDVSYAQVQVIEEHRTGSVTLFFDFSGYWLIDGSPVPFWSVQFEHEVTQSDWITILEQIGYRRILLLEFDMPGPQGSSTYAQALDYFECAQKRYLEQDWRLTVESLRQCLAALVGKKAEDEDEETDIQSAIKDLRKDSHSRDVGYLQRYEPVRMALKFLCDLGAHPEVAEPQRKHAYASLLMVAGLLQGLSRS
jgi:hypothetical protein